MNGYRFERILGRDSAGRLIFKAINYKREKRTVKIISINPPQILDAVMEETFILTSLDHPNIAESYEFMVRK